MLWLAGCKLSLTYYPFSPAQYHPYELLILVLIHKFCDVSLRCLIDYYGHFCRYGVWSLVASGSRSSRTHWKPAHPPTTMMRRSHDSLSARTGNSRRSFKRHVLLFSLYIRHFLFSSCAHSLRLKKWTNQKSVW